MSLVPSWRRELDKGFPTWRQKRGLGGIRERRWVCRERPGAGNGEGGGRLGLNGSNGALRLGNGRNKILGLGLTEEKGGAGPGEGAAGAGTGVGRYFQPVTWRGASLICKTGLIPRGRGCSGPAGAFCTSGFDFRAGEPAGREAWGEQPPGRSPRHPAVPGRAEGSRRS